MNETKRQVLPTGLWVVATPIGNLNDLSPRAIQALTEASAILCEDTRRTSQLLTALGISAQTERLDAHSTQGRVEVLVDRLLEGESLALVTDAGTPGISDPGSKLVAAARLAGVRITPVPGPSAVTALLSVAGLDESSFVFHGFFPRKTGERESAVLEANQREGSVSVWYESPERILDCLEVMARLSAQARVVVAKELTKIHERIFGGDIAQVLKDVSAEIETEGARGEWCLVLAPAPSTRQESSDWVKALNCLQDAQVSASRAASLVSQHFGVPKNTVYEMALSLFGKKNHGGG